jgi:hypothetical protein
MEVTGQTFSSATEVVDGNRYVECRFDNCTMIYRGGEIPHITGCQFDGCNWRFEDAAERTLLFMWQVYHGMGAGGRELIEAVLDQLRRPIPQAPGSASPPPG